MMKNMIVILLSFGIMGCAVIDQGSKYSHSTELGIRAYESKRPELAVVLLKPGYFSYQKQDMTDYLADVNLSDEMFDKVVDHLIVSSWESGDTELHTYLLSKHGADLHDSNKNKGSFIGRYGRVRITQIWDCIGLEGNNNTLLKAAKCWRAVGNKERSLDNFKAHYIYQEMGRQESY